jgi:predicted NUDIX family NTP pyrophosphohydrolase
MLDLSDLANGLPAISPAFGQYLAEAGAVCLESQGHANGQELSVQGIRSEGYTLRWPNVTDQMERCLNDPEVATDYGN